MTSGRIIAVAQARMGSTRLPGKSLLPVYKNYSLIELVLRRLQATPSLERVVLATSEAENCTPLANLAMGIGIDVIRGSEDDVLSRFIQCARAFKPEHIVRVCSDNPLVCPEEIENLINFHITNSFDYSTNATPSSGLPDGLGAEIVTAKAMLEVNDKALDPASREHVTKYFCDNPENYNVGELVAPGTSDNAIVRLDIDTAEDLDYMQRFCAGLPEEGAPLWGTQAILARISQLSVEGIQRCR